MAHNAPIPPSLDESMVQRLASIASEIDGCHESIADELVQEFNSLAGTDIPYAEFQGIYGGERHENYVRRVLMRQRSKAVPTLDREQLVEMFKRVLENPGDDAYPEFVFGTIEKTLGDDEVYDLVYFPGEYFGDGDDSRVLSSEQMADAVLERYNQRNTQ